MKKNKLLNLNDHLFEQLERLNDDDLSNEALGHEIKRATAMSNVARQIIDSGRLALDAKKIILNGEIRENEVPRALSLEE